MSDTQNPEVTRSSSEHTPRGRQFLLQRIAESEQAAALFTNKRVSCFIFEIPLCILMLLTILVGVGTALAVLFGLQQTDIAAIQDSLQAQGDLHQSLLLRELDRMQSIASTGSSLFNIANNVSLDQYNRFVKNNGLTTPQYVNELFYAEYVSDADKASYIAEMRSRYSYFNVAYSTFSIYTIFADGSTGPTTQDFYIAKKFSYPFANGIKTLGYDLSSDQQRNSSIFIAKQLGSIPYVTEPLTFSRQKGEAKVKGGFVISSVYDPDNNWLGSVQVKYYWSLLVSVVDPDNTEAITLFDVTDTSKPMYMHTTLDDGTINQIGFNTTTHIDDLAVQKELYDWHVALLSVPGQAVHHHVQFGQRNVTLFSISTDRFAQEFRTQLTRRWVLFAVVLIVAAAVVLLLLVATCVIRYGRQTIIVLSKKLRELRKTKVQMHNLIDTLSAEEQRTRLTMSALPLAVAMFNAQAKLIFANDAFVSAFHYTENDMQEGTIHVSKVLPQLDFKQLLESRPKRHVVVTTVSSAFQVEDQFPVSITFLGKRQRNSPLKAMKAITSTKGAFDADFIVIADTRNGLTDTSDEGSSRHTSQTSQTSRNDNAAADDSLFQSMFAAPGATSNASLLAAFTAFCSHEHADEGLAFWRAVQDYRKITDTFHRVEKQKVIFQTFLAGDKQATRPLNLAGGPNTDRELDRIRRFLGQPEVFDGILTSVLSDLRNDLFERFLRSRQTDQGAPPKATVPASAKTHHHALKKEAKEYEELQEPGSATPLDIPLPDLADTLKNELKIVKQRALQFSTKIPGATEEGNIKCLIPLRFNQGTYKKAMTKAFDDMVGKTQRFHAANELRQSVFAFEQDSSIVSLIEKSKEVFTRLYFRELVLKQLTLECADESTIAMRFQEIQVEGKMPEIEESKVLDPYFIAMKNAAAEVHKHREDMRPLVRYFLEQAELSSCSYSEWLEERLLQATQVFSSSDAFTESVRSSSLNNLIKSLDYSQFMIQFQGDPREGTAAFLQLYTRLARAVGSLFAPEPHLHLAMNCTLLRPAVTLLFCCIGQVHASYFEPARTPVAKVEQALFDLTAADGDALTTAIAYFLLAKLYAQTGRHDEGKRMLQASIAVKPLGCAIEVQLLLEQDPRQKLLLANQLVQLDRAYSDIKAEILFQQYREEEAFQTLVSLNEQNQQLFIHMLFQLDWSQYMWIKVYEYWYDACVPHLADDSWRTLVSSLMDSLPARKLDSHSHIIPMVIAISLANVLEAAQAMRNEEQGIALAMYLEKLSSSIIEKHPFFAPAYYVRFKCYEAQGQIDLALDNAQAVIELLGDCVANKSSMFVKRALIFIATHLLVRCYGNEKVVIRGEKAQHLRFPAEFISTCVRTYRYKRIMANQRDVVDSKIITLTIASLVQQGNAREAYQMLLEMKFPEESPLIRLVQAALLIDEQQDLDGALVILDELVCNKEVDSFAYIERSRVYASKGLVKAAARDVEAAKKCLD